MVCCAGLPDHHAARTQPGHRGTELVAVMGTEQEARLSTRYSALSPDKNASLTQSILHALVDQFLRLLPGALDGAGDRGWALLLRASRDVQVCGRSRIGCSPGSGCAGVPGHEGDYAAALCVQRRPGLCRIQLRLPDSAKDLPTGDGHPGG